MTMKMAFAFDPRLRAGSAETAQAAAISRSSYPASAAARRSASSVNASRLARMYWARASTRASRSGWPLVPGLGPGIGEGAGVPGSAGLPSSFTASQVEGSRGRDAQAGHGDEEHEWQRQHREHRALQLLGGWTPAADPTDRDQERHAEHDGQDDERDRRGPIPVVVSKECQEEHDIHQ